MIRIREVSTYSTVHGEEPLMQWINSLDNHIALRITERIRKLKQGNLGDWKCLGSGLFELRMFFGAGYRIYFSLEGDKIILLLCGGDKAGQRKDIAKAKRYLDEYRRR